MGDVCGQRGNVRVRIYVDELSCLLQPLIE
jgi:hypothetical protein